MPDPEYTLLTDEQLEELYNRTRNAGPEVYRESFDLMEDKPGIFRTWTGLLAAGLILGGIMAVAYLFWTRV